MAKSSDRVQNQSMRLKYFGLIPLVFWTLVVGVSFRWNWHQLNTHVFEVASGQGRDIFRMIEAMRMWNALHGGIYVIQSERTPPNPYLEVPERDPVTVSGKRMTMVNPAYMTRQMAKTILEQTGIRVHLTSLKPINPGNLPDEWEAEALRRFETGVKERAEILGGSDPRLRFMAPLVTREACLACHTGQGYKIGDVRGGISVSFSAVPILASASSQRQAILLGHGAAWLALVGLTLFAMMRIRTQIEALDAARAEQEQLVEQRTAELKAEAVERHLAESQLRHLVEATSGGLLGVDAEGRTLICNPVAAMLLQIADPHALDQTDLRIALAERNPVLAEMLTRGLRGESRAEEAVRLGDETELSTLVEVHVDPVIDERHVVGAVMTLVDTTERQQRQQQIWRQANFDHLTGLANRSLFVDRLERALLLQARAGGMAAVFFIDLDGFKPVNDWLGHAAGDAVLIEVAQRLQAITRESDIAARFGGDEFVLGLTEIAAEHDVEQVAHKVLYAIEMPYTVGGEQVSLSASIGIAMFASDSDRTETLMLMADEAMYRAKAKGKRQFCYFARGEFRSAL